ncbi:MAG: hypothetical protein GY765_14800 [bacterium]|nr:hypothetical protein [bacterium]
MERRNFLKSSAIGMVGAGVLSGESILTADTAKQAAVPKIKEYRTLGRTGFKISDISAGIVPEEGVLNALLDAGVNYIDTASLYMNGQHEKIIGKVLKNRDRKKIFITTKVVSTPLGARFTGIKDIGKESIVKQVYQCLERMQTDYLDCLMIHNDVVSDIKHEAFHAAAKQLKAEGKLKFIGISNHGAFASFKAGEPIRKGLMASVEDGRFDVFLMAYNFLNQGQCNDVLEMCRKKEIGVVLMKTNPVGGYFRMKETLAQLEKEGKEVPKHMAGGLDRLKKHYDNAESFLKKHKLEDPGEIRDAAIKFCLNNSNVGSVVLSINNFDEANRYVNLSGARLTPADGKKLSMFSKSMGKLYCRHACGECEGKCPHGVPVNTIMRYNHYFAAQGREKYAMGEYARLPVSTADQCGNCAGNCEAACPYKVPIQSLLRVAHRNLTLA